jgi:hypothetical protein
LFTLNLNCFTDDHIKILYSISLLRDSAFNWIELILRVDWEGKLAPELRSFASFVRAFKKMFGDFDTQAAAECKLERLRQTLSARVYVLEFRQAASHLSWAMRLCCLDFM